MSRLRRFLSPQLADLVLSSGDDSFLKSHRREITVVFGDLIGFTSFAETGEPEDVMAVLREYHAAIGDLVHRFEGTLERFAGDGVVVFFNDPLPCPDAPERAVRMAVAMRGRVARARRGLAPPRPRPGVLRRHRAGARDAREHRLRGAHGVRRDRQRDEPRRAAVRRGAGRQILISQRVYAEIEDVVVVDSVGELELRGFTRPARAYNVVGLDEARARA